MNDAGEYLRKAYEPLVRSMLPEMVRLGSIDANTRIILPNAGIGSIGLIDNHTRKLLSVCTPITAADNDLYVATDFIDPLVLGGIIHRDELKQLHDVHPFLRISFTQLTLKVPAAAPAIRKSISVRSDHGPS